MESRSSQQRPVRIHRFDPNRRRFLGGLAGAGWLIGTGGLVTGCSSANTLRVPLARSEAKLLRLLAPVVLHGLLPARDADRDAALDSLLGAVSTSVSGFSSENREQLTRLLLVLDYRATRWLVTGLWKPLSEAGHEEINGFLNAWRQSSHGRFNLAYRTLTWLLATNWFAMPLNYRQSGYPGPPSWAVGAGLPRGKTGR